MKKPITSPILFFALLVVVSGCSSPYGWNKDAQRELDSTLTATKQANTKEGVPPEIGQALIPPLRIPLPDGGVAPIEPRFDLAVNNAPARQVFMGLVEGTQYSMILHPDVGGTLSLNIKDVTVPEAMDAIRKVYGYQYRREGNRFFVLGRGMQTRVFQVNYLNINRKGRSDTRVRSGELSDRVSTSGATTTAAPVPAYPGAQMGVASGIQVETQSQADFWKELETTVRALIGAEGGRAVAAQPQAGLLVVRAMPDELRVVEEFLGQAQHNVNRQVVLEAKILEVQLSDRFQAGINWADIGRVGDATVTTGQVGGGTIFGGAGVSEIAGTGVNLNPSVFTGTSGLNSSAFGGVFSLAIRTASFSSFVELLQTQGEVHVLSSPRVSTVNNQKAIIKVGGEEFFVTGVEQNPVAVVGGTTVYTPSITLTPFFSGIALDVTPQIDEQSNIVLHIHPSVSEVREQNKSIRVGNDEFRLPSALSSIQESDNVVRAASGQIIVIGGLMKEGSTDDDASVPLLGDIPIVGNLFKHKRLTRIKRELVILLKPTIVSAGESWNDLVTESQGHIDRIRRER